MEGCLEGEWGDVDGDGFGSCVFCCFSELWRLCASYICGRLDANVLRHTLDNYCAQLLCENFVRFVCRMTSYPVPGIGF